MDGTYTVTLDVDATINSLTLGGTNGVQTLSASGKTLTINGTSNVNNHGALNLLSGTTLDGSGTLSNQGTLRLTWSNTINTVLVNGGTINVVNGNSAFNGVLTNQAGSWLKLNTSGGSSMSLTILNGTNHGTIELASGSGTPAVLGGGTLTNASDGIITTAVGGGLSIELQLNNQGTVIVNHNLTINRASALHTNSGTITVASGKTMTVSSGTFRNSTVLAVQAVQMYPLTVSSWGTGSGIVNGNGINCAWNGKTSAGTCSVSLAENTAVSLSASPTTGSTFAGWTGGSGSATGCSGTGACTFNITETSGVDLDFTIGGHIYLPLILRN